MEEEKETVLKAPILESPVTPQDIVDDSQQSDYHDSKDDSQDSKDDSHDSKDDSHDSKDDSQDSKDDSHDSKDDSHDSKDDSHDSKDDSQDSDGDRYPKEKSELQKERELERFLKKEDHKKLLRSLAVNREKGLSSREAAHRLTSYGPNVFELRKRWGIRKQKKAWMKDPIICDFKIMMRVLLNPISWAMLFAMLVTFSLYAIGGDIVYFYDAMAITSLLLLNYASCFVAMRRVRNAKAPLIGALKPTTKVLRDGEWREEDPENLVPGDIIFLKWGDVVPADVRAISDHDIATSIVDWPGYPVGPYRDVLYYQQSLVGGECTAVVTATGLSISINCLKEIHPNDFARPGQLTTGVSSVGYFCCGLVIIGTLIELVVTSASKSGCRSMLHDHFILLIGGLPMALPAVLYLRLACGSRKLSQLGVASRGTVGFEDLATLDTVFFNLTGTLTVNKPEFDSNKIVMMGHGMGKKDGAIILAAKSCHKECDLYRDPIDAGILDMLSNPEQAISRIGEETKYSPFNYYDQYSSRTFLLQDGRYWIAVKGDPQQIMSRCGVPDDVMDKEVKRIEELAQDGYQTLAIAYQYSKVNNLRFKPWKIVALFPFKDDYREDSVETIRNLTETGLRVVILTGGRKHLRKEICKRLGIRESDVTSFSLEETDVELEDGLLSKPHAVAITSPDAGIKQNLVSYAVSELGYRCAVVGGRKYDTLALEESHVAIAGPDASDKARCISDLVLTSSALSPLFESIQLSRVTSEMMATYLVYASSSTIHVLGILLISLLWRVRFSSFLILVMSVFNYGMGFAFLSERSVRSKSPLKWKVWKMILTGVSYGCYVVLTTIIFVWTLKNSNFFYGVFKVWQLNDDGMKTALFLQTSIANQAVLFFARSSKCCFVDSPSAIVFDTFFVLQMIATSISVYADMGFDGVKGIGWGRAVIIWTYNFLLFSGLGFIKSVNCRYGYGEKAWSWIEYKIDRWKQSVDD